MEEKAVVLLNVEHYVVLPWIMFPNWLVFCRWVEMWCARTALRSSLTLRRRPKPTLHLSMLWSHKWRASVSFWDLACLTWWEHEHWVYLVCVLNVKLPCFGVHCMSGTYLAILSFPFFFFPTVQRVHRPVRPTGLSTAHVYGKSFSILRNVFSFV